MRRLKTVRRPPIYPKTPGHLPCSSLTHPLPAVLTPSIRVLRWIRAKHYDGAELVGKQYLDKIVQIGLTVPPATIEGIKAHFGPTLTDIGIPQEDEPIIGLAAQGNPRIYHRILNNWKLIRLLRGTHPAASLDPINRARLLLATAIHVRFPSLYVCVHGNPQGFVRLWNYIRPSQDITEAAFIRDGMTEFWSAYRDPAVHAYFKGVSQALGEARDPIATDPDSIRNAFIFHSFLSN